MTPLTARYLAKLLVRIAVFLSVLFLYLRRREYLLAFVTQSLRYQFSFAHVLWLLFMVMMLRHLLPRKKSSMALRKSLCENYQPVPGYDELHLYRHMQQQNIRAWYVMLLWLSANAVFGLLYAVRFIDEADLLMLTVFYFLCDYICILFFCPFQTFIMHNKCCVNCRIYDWGHFMMFTPMLFIRNFFSWSLFFTACIVLIHWELLYSRHPERFFESSNSQLQCASCMDKTCRFKRKWLTGH